MELAVVTSRVSSSPDPVPRKVHKVQILPSAWTYLHPIRRVANNSKQRVLQAPATILCTPPQAAAIERPFGFRGEPVTTPALGDLIKVALPTISTRSDDS